MGDISNLKLGSKTKSFNAEKAAMQAIAKMLEDKKKITFYSVAKTAGVSTNFLYSNLKMRNYITKLRDAADVLKSGSYVDLVNKLDPFMLQLENDDLKRRNRSLEEKVQELTKENKVLKAHLHIIKDDEDIDKHKYKDKEFEFEEIPIVVPF